MELTQGELKRLLSYNPETGNFRWEISRKKCRLNGKAGYTRPDGYIMIKINYKRYYSHRLAFLFMEGYFPENQVDHINRDPSDNRWRNLREVSQVCNMRNCGNWKQNKSGIKGISWDKDNNKWVSQMKIRGRHIHIGRHDDFAEAVCHRLAAEQCVNWSGCDSSSPAYKYVKENINS